ncbi:MAG: hypothetical protein K5622_05745 [Endomicrobiaceae bacterium]|nr:hypothetical protein [Endomicrobiaceae bacterium]
MTSDELINLAFSSKEKYPVYELYNFQTDNLFLEYLQNNYPSVYDFITSRQLKVKHLKDGIAAVTVNQTTGQVILFINYHRITYIRNICSGLKIEEFYETLACLIMHEQLHYMLKHFRVPFEAYNHNQLNIAQDMVIDNMIHRINPGWRNWQNFVDEINNNIKKIDKGSMFREISTEENSQNDLLNFSDLDIYFYISELKLENEQDRIDKHEWNGDEVSEDPEGNQQQQSQQNNNSSQKGNEEQSSEETGEPKDSNKEGNDDKPSKPVEDMFDKLASKARERIAQNANRKISQLNNKNSDLLDKVINKIANGKEHNLFNILKKYIKKISYKQTTNTWKKISKKQPLKRPGVMFKKVPGEVLIIIDTSGSMHEFINNKIEDTMNGVYSAFAKMAKVYGLPSKIYKSDVDDRILTFNKITSVKELYEVKIALGGGNDFQYVFDKLVLNWSKTAKSSQKFPDFILVLTDFGDDFSFLTKPEYKPVENKIIWLYTNFGCNFPLPKAGHVVDVLADDWSTSIR